MIQAKNSIKCKINTPQKVKAKLNASVIYVEPDLEELEVMPSRKEQHFISEKDGYSSVIVKGDENLTPNIILKDKEVFGVKGELEAVDTSDATATAEDIKKDKTAYIDGEKVTGTLEIPEQPTKGIIINEWDSNGYPLDVSVVGLTTIPENYCYCHSQKGLFSKCTNINLPEDLTTIGRFAFRECINLIIKELPESVTEIGNGAFYGCDSFRTLKLPNGIKNIMGDAFRECDNLALTELPSELTSLGTYAFYNCVFLKLTKLPEGLTSISNYTFYNCVRLALTEIPSRVTSIGQQAFYKCSGLSELTCHGDMKTIGSQAFYGCSNLQKFVLPNITSVPTLTHTSTFNSTPISKGTGYIYVPDNLVESFKTATNWSTYADQIKGVSELV